MNHDQATRSNTLMASVVGVLVVGVVLAYALPAVSVAGDAFWDESGYSVSLTEVSFLLELFGGSWIVELARLGVVVAIVAAVGFTRRQDGLQALCISVGSLAALALPIVVLREVGIRGEQSLGLGMIAFSIACIIVAILPWVVDRRTDLPTLTQEEQDRMAEWDAFRSRASGD